MIPRLGYGSDHDRMHVQNNDQIIVLHMHIKSAPRALHVATKTVPDLDHCTHVQCEPVVHTARMFSVNL